MAIKERVSKVVENRKTQFDLVTHFFRSGFHHHTRSRTFCRGSFGKAKGNVASICELLAQPELQHTGLKSKNDY